MIFIGLFLLGLLVTFMLCPILLYAKRTVSGNYRIYHNKPLDKKILLRLEQSISIIKASELYETELKMDICLNDGSQYPRLIEKVLGKDILLTFYNKIVFTDDAINVDSNYIFVDEHRWNLTELLAHVQVHCLEFKKYGLWKSNPIARHPKWKWEGYPEYIARQKAQFGNLQNDIKIFLKPKKISTDNSWMTLPDSTETLVRLFKYRLLNQYCLEIKSLSFVQLLQDTTQEQTVSQQMMDWYYKQPN